MRIVGGRHRGRRLTPLPPSLPHGTLRPTSDRARQALFDILAHAHGHADGRSRLPGAVVLDAFCGSGALALEALSRDAARATLMDNVAPTLALAERNAELLGETARCRFIRADATKPPTAPAEAAASLVFLDPPYHAGLALPALGALAAAGWIGAEALVVIETAAGELPESVPATLPAPFGILSVEQRDRRVYGAAGLLILLLQRLA